MRMGVAAKSTVGSASVGGLHGLAAGTGAGAAAAAAAGAAEAAAAAGAAVVADGRGLRLASSLVAAMPLLKQR